MEETKKSLLSIDIDTNALTQNVIKAKKEVQDLTAGLKALKGTEAENSAEAVKMAAQLKNAQAEVRQGTATLAQYEKAIDESTGFLERQRIELNLTQKQFEKLSEEELKNVNIGGKMQKSATDLSKSVVGLDQSVGNNKSTIGAYSGQIVDALEKTGLFGGSLGKAADTVNNAKDTVNAMSTAIMKYVQSAGIFTNTNATASTGLIKFEDTAKAGAAGLRVMTDAEITAAENMAAMANNGGLAAKAIDMTAISTEGSAGAFKLLKIAIAETGIGLLIIALGALYSYFQNTNEGAKKMKVYLAEIGAVVQVALKYFSAFGKEVFEAVSHPIDTLKALGKAIVDNVIVRFKSVGVILEGIKNWDWGKIKEGVLESFTGIEDLPGKIGKVADGVKGFVNDASAAADAAAKITQERQKLTKVEREWSEEKLRQQGAVDLLTKKLRDQNLSENERIKYAKAAKDIREEIFQHDLKNAQTNLDLVQREQALNSKKDYQAITDAKNRVQEIINAKNNEVAGIENRESRLQKGQLSRAQLEKKLMSEAESERLSSIARTSQAIYDAYGDEISKTEDKFRKLIEKYKKYGQTVKQLQIERDAELKAIADKYNKDAEANLNDLNKQLADIRSKAYDDETQRQIKELDQRTKDQVAAIDKQTAAIELQINQQARAVKDLRAHGNDQEADRMQQAINTELKQLDTAGQLRAAILAKQIKDEQKIRDDAAAKKANDQIEGDIIGDQLSGNFEKEFDDRAKQLKMEHDQAVTAARLKGEDTYRIDQEYKQKSIALTQARTRAEDEANKTYLNATISTANGLMAIAGKNTKAFKAAFLAHQAAQAGLTIIDTYRAVMGIWSSDAGIPFVGVPKAIAETAIVVGAGVASLAEIWKQKPGFYKGGVYRSTGFGGNVYGPGNALSDSINARLSNGESIINARSTSMFAPLLSAINQAGGGVAIHAPNPNHHYAVGGLFTGADAITNATDDISQLRMATDMARVFAQNTPRQVLVIEDVQAGLDNKVSLQSLSNF